MQMAYGTVIVQDSVGHEYRSDATPRPKVSLDPFGDRKIVLGTC